MSSYLGSSASSHQRENAEYRRYSREIRYRNMGASVVKARPNLYSQAGRNAGEHAVMLKEKEKKARTLQRLNQRRRASGLVADYRKNNTFTSTGRLVSSNSSNSSSLYGVRRKTSSTSSSRHIDPLDYDRGFYEQTLSDANTSFARSGGSRSSSGHVKVFQHDVDLSVRKLYREEKAPQIPSSSLAMPTKTRRKQRVSSSTLPRQTKPPPQSTTTTTTVYGRRHRTLQESMSSMSIGNGREGGNDDIYRHRKSKTTTSTTTTATSSSSRRSSSSLTFGKPRLKQSQQQQRQYHDETHEYDDDSTSSSDDHYNSSKTLPSSTSMISISARKFKWPILREDGRIRGLVGLQNLGNTCFMNSCLQCICSTPPLIEYFITEQFKSDVNSRSRIHGRLAYSFASLIESLRNGRDNAIEFPSKVKDTVALIAPRFSGFGQQDVQEFLQFLLDGLHDDLNKIRKKPAYEEIKDLPHETDEKKSDRWWKNYIDRNDSYISDLFCGQLKSSVECKTCGNVSTVFDPAWEISVPIPTTRQKGLRRLYPSNNSVSLLDCFRAYTRKEDLTDKDQYYCSQCKKHRDCTKSLALYRLPYILIVHLKRFASEANSYSFRRSKITDRVDFPIRGLDLSEFSPREKEAKYDLFGISNHSGSLGGGHYTAYAKVGPHEWAHFNDSRTKIIHNNHQHLVSSEAYVLFYIRRE